MGKQFGLREILEWFERKYAGAPYNRVHVLKALTYFGDAERDPMPNMLVPLDWSDVRKFFLSQAPGLIGWGEG